MTGTYFTDRLHQRYGLNVLVAEGEHQNNVHNAPYGELARGAVLPATRAKFQAAIADLVTRGAEVIVLACTEFGLLVQAEDSPVPVINTTIAHAQAAAEMALADEPPRARTWTDPLGCIGARATIPLRSLA
jgi:aspartate racemase